MNKKIKQDLDIRKTILVVFTICLAILAWKRGIPSNKVIVIYSLSLLWNAILWTFVVIFSVPIVFYLAVGVRVALEKLVKLLFLK